MRHRVEFVAVLMLLMAASGAAAAAVSTCPQPRGCIPAYLACGLAEHFGGSALTDFDAANDFAADCSNSLVISSEAGAVGFTEASSRVNAPSFVKENAMWADAANGYIESSGGGQPESQGDEGQPYVPLTPEQKFQIFLHSTHDPATFVNVGISALLSQAQGDFRGYGGGMQGFGKRLGATLADTESSVFFDRFLFPVLYRQDPRFRRLGHGTFLQRGWHAASHVFLTTGDDGAQQVNYAHIFGRFTSHALSNMYYPVNQRGLGRTVRRTANGLLSDAGSYMFKEFWPDLRQKLIPKRFQKTAQRLSALSEK
jgi:hypothetical protein